MHVLSEKLETFVSYQYTTGSGALPDQIHATEGTHILSS